MDENMLGVWSQVRAMAVEEGTLPILASVGLDARGEEEFRFSHLTFQEYYCAAQFVRRFRSALTDDVTAQQSLVAELLRSESRCAGHALEDARWHVVLQICVELCDGQSDLRPFAEAMLACESHKLALGPGVRDPGAQALGPMLRADRTLLEIDLSKAEVGASGARGLGAAVMAPGGSVTLQVVVLKQFRFQVQELRAATQLDLSSEKLSPADGGFVAGIVESV